MKVRISRFRWLTTALLAALSVSGLAHIFQRASEAMHVSQMETNVVAATAPITDTAFPISVSQNGRYLQDAKGRPFLLVGDAAWSLIVGLKREDIKLYLADRRARGFNAIIVNLLEHVSPKNAYGQAPFLTAGSFSTPNEAYFEHADWVIREATAQGFLILLVPAYLGFNGGNEGWYQDMLASGPESLRYYGDYIGRRYGKLNNILWIQGGDYSPPQKYVVRIIADAIRTYNPNALQTAHNSPGYAGLDYWSGEPWLRVNTIYTYGPVYWPTAEQYMRVDHLPVILIESAYEFEHGAMAHRIRTQAYQALLSGAAGQVFGNNPIWHFEKPGLYDAPMGWREALDSPGSRSMTHLYNFFEQLPWWELEPDVGAHFLTSGAEDEQKRAVAALTADRRLGIVYVPDARSISLDLQMLADKSVVARWYDPRQGHFLATTGPIKKSGKKIYTFTTPIDSSSEDDWILIVQAQD